MKKFGIVSNEIKDPQMKVAERIRSFLFSHGAECVLIKEAQEIIEGI
mgnify:CR=1 FL=1